MTSVNFRVCGFWLLALLWVVAGCKPSALEQTPAKGMASPVDGGTSSFVTTRHSLGSFTVVSDELVVSDPAYDAPRSVADKGINGLVPKVKRGSWKAFVDQIDAADRCCELMAHHEDHAPAAIDTWTTAGFVVGVDSGQAGIFDRQSFAVDSTVPQRFFGDEQPLVGDQLWYSMCCKHTLSDLGAGVVPGGVVSSSGFGDGGYECYYRTDKDGTVVAVRIVFITEEDLK